jgi:hypothetical protein
VSSGESWRGDNKKKIGQGLAGIVDRSVQGDCQRWAMAMGGGAVGAAVHVREDGSA